MKTCASSSGERRKRMSSLIFSFFWRTNSSGSPSSVEPGAGTLIRYSFAIGRKTCWIRKRFDVASARCASVLVMLTPTMFAAPRGRRSADRAGGHEGEHDDAEHDPVGDEQGDGVRREI